MTEQAKGLLSDAGPFVLGPLETRSIEMTILVPPKATRAQWEMMVPPLNPETEVTIKLGGKCQTQKVPPDNLIVKGGTDLAEKSELIVMLQNPKLAVEITSIRFYK